VIVCPVPLFHSFGLLSVTLTTLLGATLVLPDAFDPEGTLVLMQRHGPRPAPSSR
jgi:acyl-CoA synthetase (AMP-forming)/AMP-acid ligase II